jgi:multidrug transporter EmrE-like cation transporter
VNGLFIIAAASACNTFALVLLKMAGSKMNTELSLWAFINNSWLFLLGGALLYLLSFVLTIKILADNTFLAAVPIFVGINFFFTVMVSLFLFKEPIILSSLAGVGLIFLGVWLISTGAI